MHFRASITLIGLFCLISLMLAVPLAHAASSSGPAVQAIQLATKKQYEEAALVARQSGSAAAIKAVEWMYIRRNPRDAGYNRLMAFVAANPNWPQIEKIEASAEAALLSPTMPLETIAAHFPRRNPVSTRGWLARARYALSKGDLKSARGRLMKAWLDPKLDKSGEAYAAKTFKSVLKKRDYETRLWRLILAQKTTAAARLAKRISKSHMAAAKAARQLIRVAKKSEQAYKKLPKRMRNSIAMRYALARYYRKRGKRAKALAMLLALPKDTARHIDHEQWWIEKRLIARHLLGKKDKKRWADAYRLVKSHGFSSGKHHDEGEFLAGWFALRKLNQPPIALDHFRRMAKKAASRTQQSRAYYWMARTHLELGNGADADRALRRAAASPTLYYGQLAREALGLARTRVPVPSATITSAARAAVRSNELVRVFTLLARAGANQYLAAFLWPLAGEFKTAPELSAVAEIVKKESGLSSSVRFAKRAGARGVDIDDWGYPLAALPKWKRIGKPVETALVYGLSRQESEFHPRALSHAGARGLMQLMPGTAKLITRQYRLKYSKKRLTADPAYNVMLGAAHLGDLVADFNGSYILTFVGYNAGPRRAYDWMKAYGDPRTEGVDAVDWVESIPFTETRKYVQKVLQNIHVYRSRLTPGKMIGMTADLKRGAANRIEASSDSKRALNCGGRAGSINDLVQEC